MNNKTLIKNEIVNIEHISQNILPFPKKYILPNLISKSIEIITVPKPKDLAENQKNVGIVIDEKLIFNILSQHYKNVLITEIKKKMI